VNVYRKIRSLQRKIDASIAKNGLSDIKTVELSLEIDELINNYYKQTKVREYPKSSPILYYYNVSYSRLKDLTRERKKFPTVQEWNSYAKGNRLLSTESIKYIAMQEWNYIQIKVERELNMNIFWKKLKKICVVLSSTTRFLFPKKFQLMSNMTARFLTDF